MVWGRSMTSRGGLSRNSIAGSGVWLEMISSAGPSGVGDHLHRTQDRRRAFGDGGIIGRLRQAKAGAQRSHQQRGPHKLAADTRQRLHLSETGVIAATISLPVGSGEVTKVGRRASDLRLQAINRHLRRNFDSGEQGLGPAISTTKQVRPSAPEVLTSRGCG